MYRVEASSTRIKRELRSIPLHDRERVIQVIQALKENPRPHGLVQLESNVYRLRIGEYRVIYKGSTGSSWSSSVVSQGAARRPIRKSVAFSARIPL
jgi:mRNA-degrading endonuclease RelE of RelBE toxin-antitoxin system